MLLYPHVVEDGQDVSDGATIDILEVMIAPLCKDQSVALLLRNRESNVRFSISIVSCLIQDSCKAMGVFSPGHVPIVVCLVSQNNLERAYIDAKWNEKDKMHLFHLILMQ